MPAEGSIRFGKKSPNFLAGPANRLANRQRLPGSRVLRVAFPLPPRSFRSQRTTDLQRNSLRPANLGGIAAGNNGLQPHK